MFVASRVYNYATGTSSSSTARRDATPSDSRVKRHPRKQGPRPAKDSPPPYTSADAKDRARHGSQKGGELDEQSRSFLASKARSAAELAKVAVVDDIVRKDDLYEVLGVKRNAKTEEIRRGFLNRSRVCHPDKLPNYPPCIVAFQKVSLAYQTLSKPSSRRLYDASGRSDLASALSDAGASGSTYDAGMASDETLNSVLYSVFCEFLDGDFEMIRVLVNALNEGNPGLSLGDEAVDSIEGAFRRLRDVMLAGKKYLTIIRFELIRLYEIQHSLRQLSYFDVFGRLRLTLQLARVTLSIPMAIDQAMKEPGDDEKADDEAEQAEQDQDNLSDGAGEDDADSDEETSKRSGRKPSVEDFGMRAEDDDDDPDQTGSTLFDVAKDRSADDRRATRAARRQARIEERRRARLEAKEAQMLQRRGLLGPTAAGLLKGVVNVLERSESWVPGGGSQEEHKKEEESDVDVNGSEENVVN